MTIARVFSYGMQYCKQWKWPHQVHTNRQESTSPLHTVRNDHQLLSDGPIHQLIEAVLMHFSDVALVKPH